VVAVDGPAVALHVEAHDGHEVIARGFHRRRVVRAAGLARRVAPKLPPASS
jgi:predicted thioesterase